jgi:hypothetical protein
MPKKRNETLVSELIGEGVQVRVSVPQALYEKLADLGKRRYGSEPKEVLVGKALVYSAAWGTLAWERAYHPRQIRKEGGGGKVKK